MRIHINRTTGETGVCKAQVSCPFGDLVTDHYSSVTAARAAYEESMRDATVTPLSRTAVQSTVSLSQIIPTALLRRELADGYVEMREHEDDPHLKVLCYSRTTQYEGHWNECTKAARGMIIYSRESDLSDAVVLQRPWRKFFTLNQLQDGKWALGDEENTNSVEHELAAIDFNAPAEVTDKMDGSLGVLYRAPDGKPALSTKGSFGSEQALHYTRLLRENGEMAAQAETLLKQESDKTFLFELVGKSNPIVLAYDEDNITLLGAVKKDDGMYLSPNDFSESWAGGVTETMAANTVGEALALPDRPGREGVVIRVLSSDPQRQSQLKVKQDDYIKLHRAITGFSKSSMRESLRNTSVSLKELIAIGKSGDIRQLSGVREELALLENNELFKDVLKEREKSYTEVLMPKLQRLTHNHKFVRSVPESMLKSANPSKEFAALIASKPSEDKPMLFTLFQARLKNQDLLTVKGDRTLNSIAAGI